MQPLKTSLSERTCSSQLVLLHWHCRAV